MLLKSENLKQRRTRCCILHKQSGSNVVQQAYLKRCQAQRFFEYPVPDYTLKILCGLQNFNQHTDVVGQDGYYQNGIDTNGSRVNYAALGMIQHSADCAVTVHQPLCYDGAKLATRHRLGDCMAGFDICQKTRPNGMFDAVGPAWVVQITVDLRERMVLVWTQGLGETRDCLGCRL